MAVETTNLRYRVTASLPATTVPNSSTLMLRVSTRFVDQLFISLTVATAALTGFAIKGTPIAGVADVSLFAATADFTTPGAIVLDASGDLTGLTAGTGWLVLNVRGFAEIAIFATSGGTATLAISAGGE